MNNQLFDEAASLRKSKDYVEASVIYKKIWDADPMSFNEWSGWSFAYTLQEIKQYDQSLEICRQLYKRFPNAQMIRQVYANIIYYSQIAVANQPAIDVLKKAVNAMILLSPPEMAYSLTPRAIFKLIKRMMEANTIDWLDIESWLLKLDTSTLSNHSFSMITPDGKKREFASPLEEWYSSMIKVKAGLNKPQELLDLLAEARSKSLKWHYNNDIWFARKEAFALAQLNQKDKAISILKDIIKQKNEWFILFDLAEMLEDENKSLEIMCKAAAMPGKVELKIRLFENIYRKLAKNEKNESTAKLHLLLIYKLRSEQGWSISQYIIKEAVDLKIDLNEAITATSVFKKLVPFWNEIAFQSIDLKKGVIEKLINETQSGFIKATDGKQYYFNGKEGSKLRKNCIVGAAVTFEIIKGFDKKRMKETWNATNLQIL